MVDRGRYLRHRLYTYWNCWGDIAEDDWGSAEKCLNFMNVLERLELV